MKTSIFVTNLEGNHFELYNTSEYILDNGVKYSHIGRCNDFDLICYHPKLFEKTLQIIHHGNSLEEVEYIKNHIYNKLYEKSQLLQQIGALKRIKDTSIDWVIEDIKQNIRNNYFEVNIRDILKT